MNIKVIEYGQLDTAKDPSLQNACWAPRFCMQLSIQLRHCISSPSQKAKNYNREVLQSQKRRLVIGFKQVHLLHDNTPAHNSAIVSNFLKQKKFSVLPHPPYSPDLAPCDFSLSFSKTKKLLWWSKILTNTGIGFCCFPVSYHYTQISVSEWIYQLKLCSSSYREHFEGMK